MKYIFSTILVLSISVFAQEPDIEGYTSVYAQYSFCNLKEGKTFSDARPYIGEYVELANSFENDVNVGVLFPMLANEPDHDFFFVEHANSREEMGAYKDKMFSLIMAAGNNEQLPMECNVNFSALNEYFTFQNVFSYYTLFEGVNMLPPANTIMINNQSKQIKHSSWWDYDFSKTDKSMTFNDAKSNVVKKFPIN